MHILAVLGMGFTSILVQVTTLRQLLTVFSGNELDIGITLAVWLTLVGVGSYVGRWFTHKKAFCITFILIGVLVQPSILFIEFIRPLFSLTTGETVPLTIILLSTIISLAPVCIAIGAQFPLSVLFLKNNSAKAYSLEAAGAFIGGLVYTFLLSGRVDAFLVAAVVSMLNVVLAFMLASRKWVAGFALIPLLLYSGTSVITDLARDQNTELVERVESRYGEITVFESQDQLNVFSSGKYEFSYPDPQVDELKAHVPMSLHAEPNRVLVIGGSPAVVREFLKYPLTTVDYVELDPAMIDVSFGILEKEDRDQMKNARLKVLAQDARQFVKTVSSHYDLVVLNLPEPATANVNRFYTVEFFREVRTAMDRTGILALTLPASHGYIGRRMQAANGSIYRSLKTVFANVALSSEEYGGMYASDGPVETRPEELDRRFVQRHILVEQFHPFLFKDIFDPLKTDMVRTRLDKVTTINKDHRPVAYVYNLLLWADLQGGKGLNWLLCLEDRELFTIFSAALLIAIASFWKRKQALYYGLFTTGYATMAFSIIILLAYQASYGYVYERIGLLTALFMAGSATGAYGARKLDNRLTRLQLIEMFSLMLFIAAPLCFKVEFLYYALTFLCGTIGGAQFVIVNRYAEGEKLGELAGRLYALDLGGSVIGAVLIALFFVPLLGIGNAILSLVLLKVSSLVLLFTVEKHH